ncbi:MAG TPA: hypothetical protein VMF65_01765 [Acidimicrobiales bacterium]|nr:hypothetical protein [Acidimicrobiales bacterium]
MPTLVAPNPRQNHYAPEAEALIAEARARRRRRWLAGILSAALATAAMATWLGSDLRKHSAGYSTARSAQLTAAATSCASALSYGPLPVWARAGFHPANLAMPYVLGVRDDIAAVLWARHDPLYSPPKPGRNNKILWVSRLPLSNFGNLDITARRLVGGTEVGPVVRRTVMGGPGPSGIDMPQPGCWQFTLRWSGHQDSVDLAYTGIRG